MHGVSAGLELGTAWGAVATSSVDGTVYLFLTVEPPESAMSIFLARTTPS